MIKIEAAVRLLEAAMADQKKALAFLTELGFTKLKFKASSEDLIKFFDKKYDEGTLTKYLGSPKQTEPSIRYDFGQSGVVAIWPLTNTVVLKNSASNSLRVVPTETHVPIEEPKTQTNKEIPVVSPNTPGSKENDDSHVPIIHVSPELDKQYSANQRIDSPMARLLFIKQLWAWLNTHKFQGQMKAPNFRLLKKQSASSMRLRGRWWPGKRLLEIAPRLFNASENFFIEIVLHEMAHQAVSEIDRINETVNKGHGPTWSKWMKHVGLNPLRFDPNDNVTYMSKNEIKDNNLENLVRLAPKNNERARVIIKGVGYDGVLVCRDGTHKGKSVWAFIDQEKINLYKAHNTLQWRRVYESQIYVSDNPIEVDLTVAELYKKIQDFIRNRESANNVVYEPKHSYTLGI
jgi:hypothetical protein